MFAPSRVSNIQIRYSAVLFFSFVSLRRRGWKHGAERSALISLGCSDSLRLDAV
jgi:hypothetical protein